MTNWYLGTMGFSYKQWLGPFYPAGMKARSYLAYYAERLAMSVSQGGSLG